MFCIKSHRIFYFVNSVICHYGNQALSGDRRVPLWGSSMFFLGHLRSLYARVSGYYNGRSSLYLIGVYKFPMRVIKFWNITLEVREEWWMILFIFPKCVRHYCEHTFTEFEWPYWRKFFLVTFVRFIRFFSLQKLLIVNWLITQDHKMVLGVY